MQKYSPQASKPSCTLTLRVTFEERENIKKEAEDFGYDISTVLRLRIFGKVEGIRITRRPRADVMLLGDLLGRLTGVTDELNKNGSHIHQIAKRLNQGSNDVFGLHSCLLILEQLSQDLLKTLNLIETAITGRQKTHKEKKHSKF